MLEFEGLYVVMLVICSVLLSNSWKGYVKVMSLWIFILLKFQELAVCTLMYCTDTLPCSLIGILVLILSSTGI